MVVLVENASQSVVRIVLLSALVAMFIGRIRAGLGGLLRGIVRMVVEAGNACQSLCQSRGALIFVLQVPSALQGRVIARAVLIVKPGLSAFRMSVLNMALAQMLMFVKCLRAKTAIMGKIILLVGA